MSSEAHDSRAHRRAEAFQRRSSVRPRVVAPRAAAIDESGEFPLDVMRAAAAHGLLGVTIPKAWGGAGLRLRQLRPRDRGDCPGQRDGRGVARRSPTRSSPSCSRTPGAQPQKERWLRRLASGEAIGAFALSEPDAGTDAANQQTTRGRRPAAATASPAARSGWPTPRRPSVAIVFACTRPGLRGQGVTAFLVPMDTPGITRTARADSLGVRGLGCMDLDFDVAGRPTTRCSARSTRDFAWRCGRCRAGASASRRRRSASARRRSPRRSRSRSSGSTFGQPIANYQAIQWMLADMATELEAARHADLEGGDAKDRQERITLEASMAKLAASEAAHKAADKAMQILASAGYRRGSVVERLFRDVRATEIYQGTSEAQRMIIAANILANARRRCCIGMRPRAMRVALRRWSSLLSHRGWSPDRPPRGP